LRTVLRYLLAFVALGGAVTHAFRPEINIDATTLALAGIAVLLIFVGEIHVKTVEVLGMKVELDQSATSANQHSPDTLQKPRAEATYPLEPKVGLEQSAATANGLLHPDSYLDIAIKLTPIEMIGAYAIIGPIITAVGLTLEWTLTALCIAFALFLLITPVYWLQMLGRIDRHTVWLTILATAFFLSWALVLGGPFLYLSWYKPVYGALLLLCNFAVLPVLALAQRP
jgi:hypothetical protein